MRFDSLSLSTGGGILHVDGEQPVIGGACGESLLLMAVNLYGSCPFVVTSSSGGVRDGLIKIKRSPLEGVLTHSKFINRSDLCFGYIHVKFNNY